MSTATEPSFFWLRAVLSVLSEGISMITRMISIVFSRTSPISKLFRYEKCSTTEYFSLSMETKQIIIFPKDVCMIGHSSFPIDTENRIEIKDFS